MSIRATRRLLLQGIAWVAGTLAPVTGAAQWGLSPADPLGEWLLAVDGDCRLYVREIGEGPPVVVLHGGPGHSQVGLYDAVLPLADSFRFILYDQRGSLLSPCDSLLTVEQLVKDLERLRETIGEERLVLLGHSAGGLLAMRYAVAHPEHVAGLALLATEPAQSSYDEGDPQERYLHPSVLAELEKHGMGLQEPVDPRERWLQFRIANGAMNLHDVTRWGELKGLFFYSQEAASAIAKTMPDEWDLTKPLADLPIPILVLVGDDDYIPLEAQRAWVTEVSNARLEVISDAGHGIWVERPEVYEAKLREYLSAVITANGGAR